MPRYKSENELKRWQRKKRAINRKINYRIDEFISKSSIEIDNSVTEKPSSLSKNVSRAIEEVKSTNSSKSSDFSSSKDSNIEQKIAKWAVKNNINREAVSELLKILKNDRYPQISLSYKTILSTPRKVALTEMPPGKFIYLGFESFLRDVLENFDGIIKCVELDINCDGAPIFDNSKNNTVIWPILGRFRNLKSPVFPFAIYGGNAKPNDFNALIKPFVDEFIEKRENFTYKNESISIKIRSIILDAPARASLCGIVGHTGYSSCPRCHCEGSRFANKTVFLTHDDNLRTNQEFRNKTDTAHNRATSYFEKIEDLDMIRSFPIDYLHNILLGIMRKLLNIWFGKNGLYPASCKDRISKKIKNHENCQPSEFQRHLRGLEKMSLWKGTELRTFLLYVGPVVLRDEISKPHYKNFMLLHIAISILIDKVLCIKFNEIANILIKSFVEGFEESYGAQFVTYNLHVVTHLADDCLTNGPLDEFSSFPFESYLGKMKKLVKSPYRPVEQIHNRISEILNISPPECSKIDLQFYLDKPVGDNQFLRCRYNQIYLGGTDNNSFVLLQDKSIVKIQKFLCEGSQIYAIGILFHDFDNTYELPINSREINEHRVCLTKFTSCKFNVNKIVRKFYVFNDTNEFALFFPLSQLN